MNNTVVFVIGPTGTGKTKFSIDLALTLKDSSISAEIVNCDSMQVYKGYKIGTDMPTEQEMALVNHHLFEFITVDEVYNANKYTTDATKLIGDMHKSNKLPIVVGGTNLYVESLLWSSFIGNNPPNSFDDDFEDYLTAELYDKLKEIDHERASQLHKNDRKRIIRSLALWYKIGIRHSQVLVDEKNKDNLMYNTLIFYLDCDAEEHSQRISKRIDFMLNNGLFEEAKRLFQVYNPEEQYHNGIFQSIAYKEIFPFIENGFDLDSPHVIEQIKQILINKTKLYSRKQRRWIKNRFQAKGLNIISIDTTDLSQFPTHISNATSLVLKALDNHGDN